MTDVKRRPSSKTQTARTSAHARAPTSTGVHQRTMKLSTEIFRLTQQMALRDPRWTKAAPGAMSDEVRGDPNSTETCCEDFLYPVKEPVRKRSTEQSGTDPPIHSVAGPGPAPAFSLRRPRSSPMEIRHRRWRVGIAASTDCWLSHPIFVADRPASTEPRSCVKHLCSRRPRSHPGRPLGARPTALWDFGRSHAAAVKGRFAGLRPPLTAADYLLETPASILRITRVTPAPYRHLYG